MAAAECTQDSIAEYPSNKMQTMKEIIEKALKKSLVKEDIWYLIDSRWFGQLKKYLGLDHSSGTEGSASAHPGPIDNGPLFQENSETPGLIKDGLIDELEYVLVPDEAWMALVEEFGLTDGQPPIHRKVIEQGKIVKHCKVEVYFMTFQLADSSRPEETVKKKFSKADSLLTIQKDMKEVFNIPEDVQTRMWIKYSEKAYELLSNLETSAQDSSLYHDQVIMIERQKSDGTWTWDKNVKNANDTPKAQTNGQTTTNSNKITTGAIEKRETTPGPSVQAPISTRYNNFSNYGDAGTSDRSQPGICGLSNLGNTCFMNSIIQGLSNTPPIMEYFANENYVEDINEDNPLSMKGEIARAFGDLVKNMWSGRYSYVVPRNFKMAVGRFAPQFSGYQQHDSQELLTFLLDGLHEDLNRIKKKPYIEMTDSGNRPDEEVAAEAWELYKKRNDSVILDLFHGLLKSTVVCPACPKISVTFDPFSCLSLPLPVKKERQIECFLVFMEPSKCPMQFKVTVPKNGCMRDLCKGLSGLSDVKSSQMIVTDVYNHKFHKIYKPEDGLHNILDRDDIFVYEVPTTDVEHPDIVITPLYLREKKGGHMTYSPSHLFGQPLLIALPKHNLTYEALYEKAVNSLSRYVTPPAEGSEWWKPQEPVEDELKPAALNTDPSEDSNSPTSEENQTPESENENNIELMEEDDFKGPPKLFAISVVNSYGNSNVFDLANDGNPITLKKDSYLALDWQSKAKELFYNEKVAEEFSQNDSYHAKPSQKKQVVRLEECLELYTTKEKLGEDDAWYCPSCQKHQQATKKFDLWMLPSVLVISLKRFSYNRYWRDKLDTQVEFPTTNLNMGPYIINKNHGKAIYDLIAVSNHYGVMGGGHYTAYGKNKDDGRWYHFDDSSVTPISESGVVTKAAYVLFYQRREDTSASNNHTVTSTCVNGAAKMNGDASSEEDMDLS